MFTTLPNIATFQKILMHCLLLQILIEEILKSRSTILFHSIQEALCPHCNLSISFFNSKNMYVYMSLLKKHLITLLHNSPPPPPTSCPPGTNTLRQRLLKRHTHLGCGLGLQVNTPDSCMVSRKASPSCSLSCSALEVDTLSHVDESACVYRTWDHSDNCVHSICAPGQTSSTG